MAGGIDWFRWHHGSVTDPKFGLVAKKSGARLGDVLAAWAFVLESASANEQRGTVGEIDAESLDYLLDLETGMASRILDAMTQRGLLGANGVVMAWEKRQPKRERPEDSSAARMRSFRERKSQPSDAERSVVTPSDAALRQETPREEKRREEKREEKTNAPLRAADLVLLGVPQQIADDFLATRKAKRQPLTRTALEAIEREAASADMSLTAALTESVERGWASFRVAWMSGGSERQPSKQASLEARNAAHAAEFVRMMKGQNATQN